MTPDFIKERLQVLNRDLTLADLGHEFPRGMRDATKTVTPILAKRNPQEMNDFLLRINKEETFWLNRLANSSFDRKVFKKAYPILVKHKISKRALKDYFHGVIAKQSISAKRSLGFHNKLIAKHLSMSEKRLEKSISIKLANLLWRLCSQKGVLLELAKNQGNYAFFSKEWLREVARTIDGRSALEIGGGNGNLSGLLKEIGCEVNCTDDYSWKHVIDFPETVEKLSASTALKKYRPKVVLCSFPPPNNPFEREVFATSSVEHYIAIVSKHDFAAGAQKTYRSSAKSFTMEEAPHLAALLYPKDMQYRQLVFSRKTNAK